MSIEKRWTGVRTAKDVTPEIEETFADYAQRWPEATTMDLIERIESRYGTLADGTYPDFGSAASTPAIRKIRKIVKDARADG